MVKGIIMVNLSFHKLFVSGPLRGLSCECHISFADMDSCKEYISVIKDIQSKSGHITEILTGDHTIWGMFEIICDKSQPIFNSY
jgi:hypothetical protein